VFIERKYTNYITYNKLLTIISYYNKIASVWHTESLVK